MDAFLLPSLTVCYNVVMKKILFFVICLPLLLLATVASAHQPRLVKGDVVEINNPEISQAFYGWLNGEPATFKIHSDKAFKLYVGVLVPDIKGVEKDVSADIYKSNGAQSALIASLDGSNSDWPLFHEDFANDNYFWGPEFKAADAGRFEPKGREVGAGDYSINVFRPGNQGKYVLVVGEKELFPPKEMLNAVLIMPDLKTKFFGKSILLTFYSRIGLYLAIPLIILIALVITAVFLIKKFKKVKVIKKKVLKKGVVIKKRRKVVKKISN